MVQVNLNELVGKLNNTCRNALEAAAGSCLSRTNYNVEIEHWLIKLIEAPNADASVIFRHFEIDAARVIADLTVAIDRLKTGNARPPALSPNLVDWIRTAWLISSIDFGQRTVRSGHLMCALLADEGLASVAVNSARDLDKLEPDRLHKEWISLAANSAETSLPLEVKSATATDKTTALGQFTLDLTAQARAGQLEKVVCRDAEIRQMIDVLCRRRQNNPLLIGDAGVGKTAVAEGFALRIAEGEVPSSLRNALVCSLVPGQLQAGVAGKTEVESRFRSVLDEIAAAATPVILFIDDAHTVLGDSRSSAKADLANVLKPALARGELRTIAATSWSEYKKHFEQDATLARCFQIVEIDEPSESDAVAMLRANTESLEKHHRIPILSGSIVEAVRLSNRYISGRRLPEKAASLLDTTCARISLSQFTTPPPVEDFQRRIELLNHDLGALRREEQSGTQHQERIAELETQKGMAASELQELQARWHSESELVARIQRLRTELLGQGSDRDQQTLRDQLADLEPKLAHLQRDRRLVHACVDAAAIAETAAMWTGIPLGRMVADESKTLLDLEQLMQQSIIGQPHALHRIAHSIRASRANLRDPRTPVGVFLLAGSSGVGKTETAITLAQLLYGGEQNMTVINMSEFKEEHKVSQLTGSPPGYVGYGERGVLTEAVRRKPHSVVLLDEFEKAHPGVQDIFYQVFDKGKLRDGEGRDVDFKNTVIIMTTNAGADVIHRTCYEATARPEPDELPSAVFAELLKSFKPAFLGRVDVVPYYPLSDDVLRKIVKLKLEQVGKRVRDHYNASFTFASDLVDAIAQRCTEVDTGARNVDHILTRRLIPQLATEFLSRMAAGQAISSVEVTVRSDGNFQYKIC